MRKITIVKSEEILLLLFFIIIQLNATTCTWTDTTSNGQWENMGNWSSNSIPTDTDDVIFDASSSNENCYLPETISIKSLTVQGYYSGTIGMDSSTIIINGNCDFRDMSGFLQFNEHSTIVFNDTLAQILYPGGRPMPHIVVNNSGSLSTVDTAMVNILSLSIEAGATFNAPTSYYLTIRDSMRNNGTFYSGVGTVVFDSMGTGQHTINIGTDSFYNLRISGYGSYNFDGDIIATSLCIDGVTLNLGSGSHEFDSIVVAGSGSWLQFASATVSIAKNADFSMLMNLDAGSGVLKFEGITNQIFTPCMDTFPTMVLNCSDSVVINMNNLLCDSLSIISGILDINDSMRNLIVFRGVSIEGGAINIGMGTSDINGDLIIEAGGSFIAAVDSHYVSIGGNYVNNGGTMLHNNGLFIFDGAGAHTITAGSNPFYRISFDSTGYWIFQDSITVISTLELRNGIVDLGSNNRHSVHQISTFNQLCNLKINDCDIEVSGDVNFGQLGSISHGTGELIFISDSTQLLTPKYTDTLPAIVHNGIGTIMLQSSIPCTTVSFITNGGNFNINGNSMSVISGGNFIMNGGNIDMMDGAKLIVAGNIALNGLITDSIFFTPATSGELIVAGTINADYAVVSNINANGGSAAIATNSRDAGGNSNWTFVASPASVVCFSVGDTTINKLNGATNISIVSGLATFNSSLSNNVGVGDEIIYNSWMSCYIKSRVNASQYYVVTAMGYLPSDTSATVGSIKRAFGSLSQAFLEIPTSMYLNTQNLVATNVKLKIACYNEIIDSTAVNISGWSTSSLNNISVYAPHLSSDVGVSQIHKGAWGADGYRLSISGTGLNGTGIFIQSQHVEIIGLQLEYRGNDPNSFSLLSFQADSCLLGYCIIRLSEVSPSNVRMGIEITGNYYTKIWNNIIYGFKGYNTNDVGISASNGLIDKGIPVYNNTVYNCEIGIKSSTNGFILGKNNLVYKCVQNYFGSSYKSGSSNNLSGPTLADAPGTNAFNASTINFIDTTNDIFIPGYGSIAIDNAVDLSNDVYISIDDDIGHKLRNTPSSQWTIGAFEYDNNAPNNPIIDNYNDGLSYSQMIFSLQYDLSDPDGTMPLNFQVQVDNNLDFRSPEIDTTEPAFSPSPRNDVLCNITVESQGEWYWRVRAIDDMLAPSSWTVANNGAVAFIADTNDAPTAILLSMDSIAEDATINTVIGVFSCSDPDTGDTHTYSLIGGIGDTDNGNFIINGSNLETKTTFDYETQIAHSIRVVTTDSGGKKFEQTFSIKIVDVYEDIVTLIPQIIEPLNGDSIFNFFKVKFKLQETAKSGTVVLKFVPVNPNTDIDSPHDIIFTSTFETVDTHTVILEATNLSNASVVASVNSDTNDNLKHLVVYDMTISYCDSFGNAAAISLITNICFVDTSINNDTTTDTPILTKPATNDTIYNFFDIDFNLPEDAFLNTVIMTLTQSAKETDINSPHDIKFTSNFEANGIHQTILNSMSLSSNINIDSVSSSPMDILNHGSVYTVKIAYQDTLGNPVSDMVAQNVTFIDTSTLDTVVIIGGSYDELTNELCLVFNRPLTRIDSTKKIYLSTDRGNTNVVELAGGWNLQYVGNTHDSIVITIPMDIATSIESMPNLDSLIISILDSTFGDSLEYMASVGWNKNIHINFIEMISLLKNMFDCRFENIDDSIISAYLYFINTDHDTAKGLIFSAGYNNVTLDTTQPLLPFTDTTIIIHNAVKQGWWYAEWATINFNGVVGVISRDSVYINNTAPELTIDKSFFIKEDSLWNLTNIVKDLNNDTVTLSLIDAPTTMIIDNSLNTLSWTPVNADVGDISFTIIANDINGGTDTANIALTILNSPDAPIIIEIILPDTINGDSLMYTTLKVVDPDIGDSLEVLFDENIMWLDNNDFSVSLTSDSIWQFIFKGIPSKKDTGLHLFKIIVKDKDGFLDTILSSIYVLANNYAPTAMVNSKKLSFGALWLTIVGEDDRDSILTYSVDIMTESETILVDSKTNTTGIFQFFPLFDAAYQLIIRVEDSNKLSVTIKDSFVVIGASEFVLGRDTNWIMISQPSKNDGAAKLRTAGTLAHWDELNEFNDIYMYYSMGSSIDTINNGYAYWSKPDTMVTVSIASDEFVSDPVSISLTAGVYGWNQVASPYPFAVLWNGDHSLWEWNATTKDFENAGGYLLPWKGYWVNTDQDETVYLEPKPQYIGRSRVKKTRTSFVNIRDWRYNISLTSNLNSDSENLFGFNTAARNGRDSYDQLEPPRMGNEPSLYFTHPEWSEKKYRYAYDIRGSWNSDVAIFQVAITLASTDITSLSLNISGYDKDDGIYLFIKTSSGIVPLVQGKSINLEPLEQEQFCTIFATTNIDFINTFPHSFIVYNPAPNPVRLKTTLRYTLPYRFTANNWLNISPYKVSMKIYDIKGRVIRDLLNKKQIPGHYNVMWDGKSNTGRRVAMGQYLLRITTGDHVLTKKMVVVR